MVIILLNNRINNFNKTKCKTIRRIDTTLPAQNDGNKSLWNVKELK